MRHTPGLTVELDGSIGVASLRGELDIATRHEVEQALRAAFPDEAAALMLDLTEVGFLDSSAVQMLFQLRDDLARSRRTLAIVIPSDALPRRSIEICDSDGVLDLHPTRRHALRALARNASTAKA